MLDCRPRAGRYNGVVPSPLGRAQPVRQEKFWCQCIVCSYTKESEVHCLEMICPRCGGTMRRLERPGPGQPRRMPATVSLTTLVDTYDGLMATVLAAVGTISRKELEYNGTRKTIPASNIPIGTRGLLHIWGRNDSGVTQDLGIHWQVFKPNGLLAEDYWDWSYGHGPGDDHEFIGGRFDLNMAGNWTVKIGLSFG